MEIHSQPSSELGQSGHVTERYDRSLSMAPPRVLLIIPPLTQLNTPYPSTAYLTGFLQSRGYAVEKDSAPDGSKEIFFVFQQEAGWWAKEENSVLEEGPIPSPLA